MIRLQHPSPTLMQPPKEYMKNYGMNLCSIMVTLDPLDICVTVTLEILNLIKVNDGLINADLDHS